MKWTRRFFTLGLVLALSATVSCTGADSPTSPEAQTVEQQQQAYCWGICSRVTGSCRDGLLSGDGLVGGILDGAVEHRSQRH